MGAKPKDNASRPSRTKVPKVAYAGNFSSDLLEGEFNLPFHLAAFVDSAICCPARKTNWRSSNLSWRARELPPAWHALSPRPRSRSVIWCNCGQARIHTGKQAYCWFARCVTTGASAESYFDPTGAATARRGTRTASPRFCASAEPHFRPQQRLSTAPATLRRALNVWGETAGSERSIRYRQLNSERIRPPPTFEIYSILPTLLGSWTGSD
jgi:hypothetical protein